MTRARPALDRLLWPLIASEEGYIVTLVVAAFAPSLLSQLPMLGVGNWEGIPTLLLLYYASTLALQAFCGLAVVRSRHRLLDTQAALVRAQGQAQVEAARRASAEAVQVRNLIDALQQRDRARRIDRLRRQTQLLQEQEQDLDGLPPWG